VLPVDRAVYGEHLRQAMLLIEGRSREVCTRSRARWSAAAGGALRGGGPAAGSGAAIAKTQEQQQAVAHWGGDQDVFGLYREGGAVEVQVLLVRDGKLVGHHAYSFDGWEFDDGEVLEAVLTQFYHGGAHPVPDEILLPGAHLRRAGARRIPDGARRPPVAIITRSGATSAVWSRWRRRMRRRAFARGETWRRRRARRSTSCAGGCGSRAPSHIECVDIATFQGGETVGALVAFRDGRAVEGRLSALPHAAVTGTDDFASVAEVLRRRFRPDGRQASRRICW
jgi:excinuclease ABC subunit C